MVGTLRTRTARAIFAALVIGLMTGPIVSAARADIALEQYEFQGQPGTETSVAASLVASNITGLAFSESAGLTPSVGVNSIAVTGFNNPGVYFAFGLNVQAGYSATVDQLVLTSRSSATGPGFLNVLASVDGGAFKTVGSFTQTGTAYNDEFLSISPVTANKSLIFEIVAANQVSAGGGTIGSGGTFRIGDYNPAAGPLTPFTINGTVTPLSTPSVPEPSSAILTGLGALGSAAFLGLAASPAGLPEYGLPRGKHLGRSTAFATTRRPDRPGVRSQTDEIALRV